MKWHAYVFLAGMTILAAKLPKLIPKQFEELAIAIAITLTFVAAPLLMRRARRSSEKISGEMALPAQAVLDRKGEDFALYLRSFDVDSLRPIDGEIYRHLLCAYGMPEETHEVDMVAKLSLIAPIVAIGKPKSEASAQLGAYKYYVPDGNDWQEKVRELILQAKMIFVRVGNMSPGLMWELEEIKNCRNFTCTALIFAANTNRVLLYGHLLEFFPINVKSQLPDCAEDIQAIYVDSTGKCHLVRKRWPAMQTMVAWVTERLFELASSDANQVRIFAEEATCYSVSGVRCWHRDGIGLTPRNSFAGKILISAAGFHFLSSGSSLMSEIFSQASALASANATQSLNLGAELNPGGLLVIHSNVEELEVRGSLFQAPHIRLKYWDTRRELRYSSFALDGNLRNTCESLNLIVQNYIQMRQLVDA
ncbi:hypothetical protein [Lysobacter hankyongensis]|uniref:Uncharacterized protein n=1 Tax=Lysobacter hankyongensis TaxID=1176535 RepID=A0ABP9C6K6_9GAMM